MNWGGNAAKAENTYKVATMISFEYIVWFQGINKLE